jgi:hypothetical protein
MVIDFQLIVFILTGLTIILLGWIGYLHVKIQRLLVGKNAKTLEDTINHTQKEILDLRGFEKECLAYFSDIEKRLSRSIQAVETVRFNPFKGNGEGGNQSFSTALINEHGDGVVVSSLYSRDRVSIFSKPLSKFQSEYELTEEEHGVLGTAKDKLKRK